MAGATFHKDVNLGGVKLGGQLEMTRSTFVGVVALSGLKAGHLFMSDTTFQNDVHLTAVNVEGMLAMNCSEADDRLATNCPTFAGTVDMNSL